MVIAINKQHAGKLEAHAERYRPKMTEGYTDLSPVSLPQNCVSCGLHQNCKSYKIEGRGDTREVTAGKPLVLCVGQSPGRKEDFEGAIFIGPSGEFLQQFLDNLEVRWYLHNAVQCYQGKDPATGADKKVTAKQIEHCNVYLKEVIAREKPGAIICFGEVALKAVLGKSAPRTMKEASRNIYDFEGVKVFANYHPVNDMSVTGRRDLFDPYVAMFNRIEQELQGTYREHKVEYSVIRDPHFVFPKVTHRIMDIEDTHWDDDPHRKTIFHLGSELLCWSCCYKKKDEYVTHVFIDEGLSRDNLINCMRDTIVVGHNLKYDFLGIEVFADINVYEFIKDFFDTFNFFFLQDQSKFGNGLKELCRKYLGAPDWAAPLARYLKEDIARKKALNVEIGKINRARIKEDPNAELMEKVLEVTNLGEVPRQILLDYSANDSYWNARLFFEIVPNLPEIPEILWNLTKGAMVSLQRMEKHGIPCDTKRLKKVAAAAKKKQQEIFRLLHSLPEVQAVLDGWSEVEGETIKEYKAETFNPRGWKFLESLAYKIDFHTWETTSETSERLKFNDMTWRVLIGKNKKPEERTRQEWIWYYIWNYRQLLHLETVFIKNLVEYAVDGYIHTTFKLGKASSESEGFGGDVDGGIESGRIGSSNPNMLNLKKDVLLRSCIKVCHD